MRASRFFLGGGLTDRGGCRSDECGCRSRLLLGSGCVWCVSVSVSVCVCVCVGVVLVASNGMMFLLQRHAWLHGSRGSAEGYSVRQQR